MIRHRTWLGFLPVLLSVGCAVLPSGQQRVADGKAALDAMQACCVTLSTAARVPLPLVKSLVEVDGRSQAFRFDDNKAFFKLFALPEFSRPYSIVLSSLASGNPTDMTVLVPRIVMFNANFVKTRQFEDKTLRNRGANLERTVFINSVDSQERYLAVYGFDLSATFEAAYSQVTTQSWTGAGGAYFMTSTGTDGKSVTRVSPVGQLQIEIQGLAEAKP